LKPFEKEEREVGEQVTEVTKMIDEKEGVQVIRFMSFSVVSNKMD